jgi:hypothetical protein
MTYFFIFPMIAIVSRFYAMISLGNLVKKLLPYLLLNIIVSALAMLAVLLIWNTVHPAPAPVNLPNSNSRKENTPLPSTGEILPLDQPILEVQAVIVPGDLESERVLIRNVNNKSINLSGWIVDNNEGAIFSFPALTLFAGSEVALYSRTGENTTSKLFWGLSQAAWKNGATVTILDPQGNVRATYVIP